MIGRKNHLNSAIRTMKDVIGMARSGEQLTDLPRRITTIIERYDDLDIDPKFRQDIYSILVGACEVAETMQNPAFPADKATEVISHQLSTFSRVLFHLQSRPVRTGFSILVGSTQGLVGQFATETEANEYLKSLRGFNAGADCLVVPVNIYSQFALQPKGPPPVPSPAPTFDVHSHVAEGPIPQGIIPDPPLPFPPPPPPPPAEILPLSPTENLNLGSRLDNLGQDRLSEIERELEELNRPTPPPTSQPSSR